MKSNNKKSVDILIVEDSSDFSNWLMSELMGLKNIGSILVADEVSKALSMITEYHFDVVILDVRIKEGLGTDILSFIRDKKMNMEVIMFSNYPEFKDQCMKMGADYFFDKSGDCNEIIDTLKRMTERLSLNNYAYS